MDGKFECNAVDISREDNQIYLYYHARIQMDGKFEFPIHTYQEMRKYVGDFKFGI